MSSAVQWIKVTTDLFDDEKVLLIDTLPEADSILIIWIKLLCLAGKQNNKGVFMFNNIPYTVKMLSTILRRDESVIENALKIFEEYNMIQYVDRAITITNWGKHQNLDKIEANKAYMRNYMRNYRSKQRKVAIGIQGDEENEQLEDNIKSDYSHKVYGKVNYKVKINLADKELNKEKDTEIDKENSKEDEYISSFDEEYLKKCQEIIDSYNSTCKSLSKVMKITEQRIEAIHLVMNELENTTFEQLFEKVEKSDFLSGRKGGWRADFDWIMKPEHILKILEGKYDDVKSKPKEKYSDCTRYENLTMEV